MISIIGQMGKLFTHNSLINIAVRQLNRSAELALRSFSLQKSSKNRSVTACVLFGAVLHFCCPTCYLCGSKKIIAPKSVKRKTWPELLLTHHVSRRMITSWLSGVFRAARLGFVILATFRGTVKFAPQYVGGYKPPPSDCAESPAFSDVRCS